MAEPTSNQHLASNERRAALEERVAAEAHLIEMLALRFTPSWAEYERGVQVPEWNDRDRVMLRAAVERFEHALQQWTSSQ